VDATVKGKGPEERPGAGGGREKRRNHRPKERKAGSEADPGTAGTSRSRSGGSSESSAHNGGRQGQRSRGRAGGERRDRSRQSGRARHVRAPPRRERATGGTEPGGQGGAGAARTTAAGEGAERGPKARAVRRPGQGEGEGRKKTGAEAGAREGAGQGAREAEAQNRRAGERREAGGQGEGRR